MSPLLLDSHVLLWARGAPGKLSDEARCAVEDGARAVFFSSASIWELAIKQAKGKLDLPDRLVESTIERGFTELPIRSRHARLAGALPLHHNDPFDRMLVAQAQAERLTLVTSDPRIAAYDVPVLW